MYYLFVSNKPLDMLHYEAFLNSVIVDEFYFEAIDEQHGYIETGEAISDILRSQISLMNEDMGVSISFLSSPYLDALAYYLLDKVVSQKKSGYLSLADACLLAFLKQDTYVWEQLQLYFDKIDKEILGNIITFVKHGCNVLATSKILFLHRNTMNHRLSKFSEITSLDLRNNEHIQLIYLYALIKENGNFI